MRRLLAVLALGAGLVFAAPAAAVIHGQPDTQHPYVGMVFNDEFVCSGTLISPTVFLTAGHCSDFLKVPSQGQGWVTFQQDGQSFPTDHKVRAAYTYPGFCNDGAFTAPECPGNGVLGFAQNDVGVVILQDPVQMSQYGQLPSAGLVDQLAQKTDITQVGYGVRVHLKKLTDQVFQRYFAHAQLYKPSGQSWSSEFYRVTADFGGGKGGVCFGDSGGPDFLGSGTTVLGVHSLVNNLQCAGGTLTARIDRPEVLSWIRSFE
jgi:hypothetical protein